MPIVVNFMYIFKLFQQIGSKIYQINKKTEMKIFGKSKINYYDVTRQLQFAPKFV